MLSNYKVLYDYICTYHFQMTIILYFCYLSSKCNPLFQNNHLNAILEGISNRALNKRVTEDEMLSLQSLIVKLLSHFKHLEDVFSLVGSNSILYLIIFLCICLRHSFFITRDTSTSDDLVFCCYYFVGSVS